MEKLQCFICGVGNGILGEIIKRLFIENDIEVYDCDCGLDDLLISTEVNDSFVIVDKTDKQLPQDYQEILARNNNLIVIELLNDGRGLSLHINDINETVINKIMNLNDPVKPEFFN